MASTTSKLSSQELSWILEQYRTKGGADYAPLTDVVVALIDHVLKLEEEVQFILGGAYPLSESAA